jgi:hypothetical protein
MTEKKKSEAKRKFHCACATGDLSAIQPVTVPSENEAAAKPVESKTAKPSTAVESAAVDKRKTRG